MSKSEKGCHIHPSFQQGLVRLMLHFHEPPGAHGNIKGRGQICSISWSTWVHSVLTEPLEQVTSWWTFMQGTIRLLSFPRWQWSWDRVLWLGYKVGSSRIKGLPRSWLPCPNLYSSPQTTCRKKPCGHKGKMPKRRKMSGGSCCCSQNIDGHQTPPDTHLETSKTSELLRPRYYILHLDNLVKDIVSRWTTCTQVSPYGGRKAPEGICA